MFKPRRTGHSERRQERRRLLTEFGRIAAAEGDFCGDRRAAALTDGATVATGRRPSWSPNTEDIQRRRPPFLGVANTRTPLTKHTQWAPHEGIPINEGVPPLAERGSPHEPAAAQFIMSRCGRRRKFPAEAAQRAVATCPRRRRPSKTLRNCSPQARRAHPVTRRQRRRFLLGLGAWRGGGGAARGATLGWLWDQRNRNSVFGIWRRRSPSSHPKKSSTEEKTGAARDTRPRSRTRHIASGLCRSCVSSVLRAREASILPARQEGGQDKDTPRGAFQSPSQCGSRQVAGSPRAARPFNGGN